MPLSDAEELEMLQLQKQKAMTSSSPTETQEQPGLLSRIGGGLLSGAAKIANTVDSYSGAPVRAAVGSLEDGGGLSDAASAYGKQFGANPEDAPSGRDLVTKLGASEKPFLSPETAATVEKGLLGAGSKFGIKKLPDYMKGAIEKTSPADALGFGANVVTDPLTFLPVGKAVEGTLNLAKDALPAAGKAIGGVAKGVADATAATTGRVGNALTGVEKGVIKTYIDRTKEVTDLAKKYGNNLATASDDVRAGFMDKISAFKKETNDAITQSLETASPKKNIVIKSLKDDLEASRAKLHPVYDKDQISQLDDLIGEVNEANKFGKTNAAGLYQLKQRLGEVGAGSFKKSGQIFMPGSDVQKAAASANRVARNLLVDSANTAKISPEIIEADSKLHQLHKIEGDINKNMLAEGKSHNALVEAGRVPDSRNATNLRRLDGLTGKSFSKEAENLGAMSRFGSPDLLPVEGSGKSTTRMMAGGGLGALGGMMAGPAGVAAGAGIGSVFSSPALLKAAIQTGKIGADTVRSLSGGAGAITEGLLSKASQALSKPENRGLLQALTSGAVAAPATARGLMR